MLLADKFSMFDKMRKLMPQLIVFQVSDKQNKHISGSNSPPFNLCFQVRFVLITVSKQTGYGFL